MNNTRNILWTLLGVAVLALVVYGVWAVAMRVVPKTTGGANGSGVICTTDATQCADGSWVGRSGPNCQFVCPIPRATSTPQNAVTVETHLNQKVIAIAESITPIEIVEDSRCPHGVQCIQAGTVRVNLRIEGGSGISTAVVSLNNTITTETEKITLVAVRPEKEAGKKIAESDYAFVFVVSKR